MYMWKTTPVLTAVNMLAAASLGLSSDAYIRFLESCRHRVAGSAANASAGDWLPSRLKSHGYPPISDMCSGSARSVHDVMACTEGFPHPHHYIISIAELIVSKHAEHNADIIAETADKALLWR